MEKEYQVYGTITIQVELDITASSEEEAIEKAKEQFTDDYGLDVNGYSHMVGTEEMDLTAIEYDED
jgi:hypothetical protein